MIYSTNENTAVHEYLPVTDLGDQRDRQKTASGGTGTIFRPPVLQITRLHTNDTIVQLTENYLLYWTVLYVLEELDP